VGIMQGGEIVNKRTSSPPEIREGEELIETVLGSVAFTCTQFNVNPANSTTFPWLSKIAQLFERYEFEQLSFHFGHDVSGFATQGQTGLVYLSALYDAAAAQPQSVTQIEATDPFVPCMPNQDSCLRMDKKSMFPSNEPKFCLQGNPPGGTDIKTYNCASLFVSTTGMANATEIGKLRVRYRVRLFDRILDASQAAAPANFSVSLFSQTGVAAGATTVAQTLAFATSQTNGLGVVNTAGSMVPPAGNYLVDIDVTAFNSVATDSIQVSLQLLVGGVAVGPPMVSLGYNPGAPFSSVASTAISQFISVNGSSAVTVTATCTYTAGTATTNAAIRFAAA
jgi:hypothetical protein